MELKIPEGAMERALAEAEAARARGEVPVGAALYDAQGRLIAAAGNRILELKDPTAHAELLALRAGAAALANERLLGTTLVSTLEPCAMCAGAMVLARVRRLVYGAADPKAGGVESVFQIADHPRLNHRIEIRRGVLAEECGAELQRFFAMRRKKRMKDEG